MTSKAQELTINGGKSGEYYVIIVKDNVDMFVMYSPYNGYFSFSRCYEYATRYYKSDAETIIKCLEKMKAAESLDYEKVFIREIRGFKKKGKIRKPVLLFPNGIDGIETYKYGQSQTRLHEVSKMDKSLAKVNNNIKLIKPKAGAVITDNGAIQKTVNNGVPAESPKQIFEFIVKPYTSIKNMPLNYVYNTVIKYFNSLVAEIRDKDGKVVDYRWIGIPEKRGLALALGCGWSSLDKIVDSYNKDNDDDDSEVEVYNPDSYNQLDMKEAINTIINQELDTPNNITIDSIVDKEDTQLDSVPPISPPAHNSQPSFNTTNTSKYSCNNISPYNAPYNGQRLKTLVLKRALSYIEYYKVKCLYGSSPVGAMFDLKCNYKWVEKQSLTIEAGESILGRQRSAEEMARMAAAVEIGGGRKVGGADFDLSGLDD